MPNIVEPQKPSEEEIKAFSPDQEIESDEAVTESVESVLPAKYQKKSIEEIIAMHQEAEKVIGRQGQEVKQVRDLADQLLKRELTQKPATTPEPTLEDIDYFTDPKKAIAQTIENHPAVKAAREQLNSMQQNVAMEKLKSRHPDMKEILSDDTFSEFVKASRIRQELFQRADSSYDFEAADELLSTYKLQRAKETEIVKDAVEEIKTDASKKLKSAAVTTGSPTSGSSKKIYSRAELLEWRLRYPSKYAAIADDVTRAYEEGRVR